MKKTSLILLFLLTPDILLASDRYEQYLALLGFELEKSNLIEIQEMLGQAPINHSGDAGGSYYGLCYVLPKQEITVYFESGEMGGNKHDLLSFAVKSSVENKLKCGELSNTSLKDIKVGILSVGEKIDTIKSKLPQPISKQPYGYLHKNFGQRPFTQDDIKMTQVEDMKYAFWDVFTSIEVYEKNGLVSGYKVSRVTSW